MSSPTGPVSTTAATNTEHALIISEEMHGGDYHAATEFVTSNQLKLDAELSTSQQSIEHRLASAAPGSADFYVEVEALVDFYNTLSEVHQELSQQYEALRARVYAAAAQPVSPMIPEIQRAWEQIKASAGWTDKMADPPPNSMLGNMMVIDQLVVDHMDAVLHNLKNYVKSDQHAVDEIGRAAALAGTAKPAPSPVRASHPSTTTW